MIPFITNNFYDSFIAAVEEEVKQSGYSLMILQSGDDPAIEIENLKIYRQNRVSGVFICLAKETINLEAFHKLKDADIPVVFFDKVPDDDSYNRVCLADKEAAVMAAEALLKKNKKNILGIFGDAHMSITKRRLKAFQETIAADKNVKLSIEHAGKVEEAETITNSYFQLKKQPDAVFCMSDEILMGVMKTVQKLKIEVPQQTGIVTLSDGFFPTLYYPEIAYVETSGYRLGKLACERMMQCLQGKEEAKEIYVSSRFVDGGSL
jgi:LacI family transcriptional regulator